MAGQSPVVAVQVRMSSARFPGKALAELQGRTVIEHITNSIQSVGLPCFVLTSDNPSDDPLVDFLKQKGQAVFRGPLDDVLSRFQLFMRSYSFSHVIRISGDSPLIHPDVIRRVLADEGRALFDIRTNLFPRSFPKGQSVEMLSSDTLNSLSDFPLSFFHREHVTTYIYENPGSFEITNFTNVEDLSKLKLCVDYPSDLEKLSRMLDLFDLSISGGFPSWGELSLLLKSRAW